MIKYLVGVAVVLSVISGAWLGGRSSGIAHCQSEQEQANKAALEKQAALLAELDSEKAKKATATKVRTIYVEKDPTGCADTAIPNGMLEQLKPSN